MLKLRYYCQAQGNKEIVNLLAEIEAKHKIPFEISDLSRHGAYDVEEEKRVYERDFKPRARILKKRTGKSVRKELRGGKGKKRYYVSIPGTIAVVRDEEIEWYTLRDEEILKFPDSHQIMCLTICSTVSSGILSSTGHTGAVRQRQMGLG